MAQNREININVKIAERTYPITVDWNYEEIVRKVGHNLNKKTIYNMSELDLKDVQDAVALAGLEALFESHKAMDNSVVYNREINSLIEGIERELVEYI